MKQISFILTAIFGLFVWSCSNSTEDAPETTTEPIPDSPITYEFSPEQSRAAEASIPFMNNFWIEADAQMGEDNYVVSPVSADVLLSMVANTSTGKLGNEITAALGCNDKTVLNEVASKYTVALPNVASDLDFGIYNAVWYTNQFVINRNFSERMEYFYDADVFSHPFDDSLKDDVNGWCSEKTKGLIPEILNSSPNGAVILLADALYLKGAWANPFVVAKTTDEIFHGASGDANVKMMHSEGLQHFAEGETFKAIRMEIGKGTVEAVFILPDENQDMQEFLNNNLEAINNARFYDCNVDFSLPRFKFVSNQMYLNDILSNIGMPAILESDTSDVLSGCGHIEHGIYQRTSLEFNEQGAEGAAVTWDIMAVDPEGGSSAAPSVNLNRPFFVMVRVAQTGAPLFAGRINNL